MRIKYQKAPTKMKRDPGWIVDGYHLGKQIEPMVFEDKAPAVKEAKRLFNSLFPESRNCEYATMFWVRKEVTIFSIDETGSSFDKYLF